MNKGTGFLFFVFLFYVAIRLVPFFFVFDHTNRFFQFDSYDYNELGQNIALHGYYVPKPVEPGLRRSPGYPVYLAIIYRLFGVNPAIALFFQIILSGFIPIFLYLNARLLFSKSIGAIASVISIFEPVSIIYSNMLLAETLFVLFLLMSTYFFIRSLKSYNLTFIAISSMCAVITAYLRAIDMYIIFVFAFLYLINQHLTLGERIKSMGFFIIIFIALIIPWFVRNYEVYGYKGFCSIQDTNLYNYRAAGVVSEIQGISLKDAQSQLEKEVPEGLSLAQTYQFYRDHALRIILHHPYAYLVVMLKGSINMLLSPERYTLFKLSGIKPRLLNFMWQGHSMTKALKMILADPPLIVAMISYQIMFNGLLLLFVFIGIIVLAGEGYYKELLFLLTIMSYFVVLSAGPEAEPRFRLTTLPYEIITASVAIASMYGSFSRRHYKKTLK
ncbi:MAG: glycosyltransferase family 39 protein [Deltaproteobacteria bacterium]|nr:glycosyltransferase family 39 protein [Deltaproteobacteria bacterium]